MCPASLCPHQFNTAPLQSCVILRRLATEAAVPLLMFAHSTRQVSAADDTYVEVYNRLTSFTGALLRRTHYMLTVHTSQHVSGQLEHLLIASAEAVALQQC